MRQTASTSYYRWLVATTVLTFLLITVGVSVRAAGAGLGCPDWPKCFGMWAPPSSAAQLPAGFDAAQFNPLLTWTEYVNRLVGIVVGFFMLGLLILAVVKERRRPLLLWGSVTVFLLTGFQGWLGGRVVSAELAPIMVTFHLAVALIIAGLLVALLYASRAHGDALPRAKLNLLRLSLVLVGGAMMAQIIIGTRLRGWIDTSKKIAPNLERHLWLPESFWPDHIHRQLALLTMVLCAALFWLVLRYFAEHKGLLAATLGLVLCTVGQMFVGLGLAYGGLPPVLQVLHVTAASFMWAFWLWLMFVVLWPCRYVSAR